MEEICSKNKCCGCHACMNICPKKAIIMKEDERGFKYPVIDQNKCINCGMCKRVCPIIANEKEKEKKIISYACYNKNLDERLNSSSGGIFILLAKEIIRRNGIVCGAAFDDEFNVRHIFIEKEKDLRQLMGSKYTQSTIGDTYKQTKQFLDSGKYVLFTGTPCQIEGLKSYLRKEYDKLYTQDIICHGVPSPKVWKKYLEYQRNINNEEIKAVSFRNKDNGWSSFRTKILFNSKEYSESHTNDLFMKVFLNNICLRDSCYECSFKKKYRNSDITLADYWGINRINQSINDNKGISLVMINTKKGQEIFDMIKNDLYYEETDLDKAINYNIALVKSVDSCPIRSEFFDNLDNNNFDELVKKYVPKKPLYKRIITKGKNFVKRIIRK